MIHKNHLSLALNGFKDSSVDVIADYSHTIASLPFILKDPTADSYPMSLSDSLTDSENTETNYGAVYVLRGSSSGDKQGIIHSMVFFKL